MNQARVTMREFIENIGDDEDMLKFAADHMDADENEVVEITVEGPLVTYMIVGRVIQPHEDL